MSRDMDIADDLFSDLTVADETPQAFVRFMQERLPGTSCQLVSDTGALIAGDTHPLLPNNMRRHLVHERVNNPEPVAAEHGDGRAMLVRPIDQLNATLLVSWPAADAGDVAPLTAAAIDLGVALYMAHEKQREDQAFIKIRKKQFDRKFNVIEKKYQEILEDNYKGHQTIQRQQREYSEKLKSEIDRQTAELRQANEHLVRAREAAEAANRAKSQFLANMSHEIRTPINGIIGFTEIILETELNESQREYAQTIKKSSDILLSLINDILDSSKIEAGELDFETTEFDPELLAYDVCDLIRPRIQNDKVEVLCRIGDNLPMLVKGDPLRFRQVLTNLMGNASKFTPAGEIELLIDIEEETAGQVKLHAQVRDTGIGIQAEKMDAVFTPFQQADSSTTRKYGGTGLGLTICRQIARIMQGDVWAESEPARGSTFHFTAWLGKVPAPKSRPLRPAALAGKRILVVSGNATHLGIVTHLLESSGMEGVALDSGLRVMDELAQSLQSGEPYDACLLDLKMDGTTGIELAGRIRIAGKPWSRIPLIATSALMERDVKKCEAADFNGFLSKPIRREKLFGMLERVLAGAQTQPHAAAVETARIKTQYSVREELKQAVRILLAEDNPINQKLVQLMLTKAGYEVIVASDGREVVGQYREAPEDFDLIFMDVQMPEMDGLKATEAIRKFEAERAGPGQGLQTRPAVKRNVPIVAMTANAMKEDRDRCLAAGMDDYITKPLKRELVFAVIEKWVMKKDR